MVRNPKSDAGAELPYSFSLFDAENILVAERRGTVTLEPGGIVPLFEANIRTGERIPVRTFVDVGIGTFIKKQRATSPVRTLSFAVDREGGRVTALLENQSLFAVSDITVTALAFDAEDIVRFASQTTIDAFAARERREIVFTWQGALQDVTRVDIIPRVLQDF